MKNKYKTIEALIRYTWSSLESHLSYMHKKSWEGKVFHRRCVKMYLEVLRLLGELL